MRVLLETHPAFADHDAGPGHPERPERLDAVLEGVDRLDLGDDLVRVEPRPATRDELVTVHGAGFVDALHEFCVGGGGRIDPDTRADGRSWQAAVLAAGSALDAVERLEKGEADAAFCAARPPGHHAGPAKAMGFCLLNGIAVCASVLADRGEKVLIADWDAHHGNGTQDVFYSDPRVLYVSMHQSPLFPGSGRLEEIGEGDGEGTTVNFPVPPGATGDVYLAAFDRVVDAVATDFDPAWVLVSAGFDAHRSCPITSLGLSAGDYADLMRRSAALAPPGRCVAILEGGYDLDALRGGAEAAVGALVGLDRRPEPPTSGGPGMDVVEAAAELRSSS
ncbi:MAG TPA: histone deacetylase [Acidimicrobiales bacterium]|jgi:acetoin utilization deacetylase AcuC-like enzyme|nr:histone deacetylase [Acidimicrobiales bacterium]